MTRNSFFALIIAEDLQAATVVYRYAVERGFKKPRVLPLPSNGGGEAWVRRVYAAEVRALRAKGVRQVLIVHVDADNGTVDEHQKELATALADAGLAPRAADEPIAHVIPRWEMETWLHHAQGEAVVETVKYSKYRGDEADAAKPLVAELGGLVNGSRVAPAALPSLATCVAELRRLP